MYLLDRQYLVRLELPLRLLTLWNLMDQSHQYFLLRRYFHLFPWDLFDQPLPWRLWTLRIPWDR